MIQEHFKFSIVVPIYNVEKYLEETIESILNQTIGFEENIQLILVNDGSTDNSEEICLKYKEKHPENIVYVKQENGGVSSARNKGIDYIEGKYVNFLDGDDKWSSNALEIIYNFFEKNSDAVDFVVARKQFFEAKEGFHFLDYKFEKTKIVDIFENYNFVQMDVTSVFIKSSVAKQFKFNENLKYAEDADYINRIIVKRNKYGVIREAVHLYRKRLDETSALQTAKKSKTWFTDTIDNFHKKVIENSINTYGKIIPYVQFMIMYDLQWRLKRPNFDALNEKEKNEYIDNIVNLIKNIEDHIIIEQKNINSKFKLYALSLKYGKDITNELEFKDGNFYFNNLIVYELTNKKETIKIEDLKIKNNVLKIQGKALFAIPINLYKIYFNSDLKSKNIINLQEDKRKEIITFKEDKLNNYIFNIDIPLKKVKNISFIFEYKNEIEYEIIPRLEKGLKTKSKKQLCIKNKNYKITLENKNLVIKRVSLKDKIKRKLKTIFK